MRIQVLSDLHFEFHRDGGATFLEALEPADVDVLIVAGDLTTETALYGPLAVLCDLYPHVVFVAGNHEYYRSSKERMERKLEKTEDRFGNLHWLHETSIEIDGRRFLGTTLWFPEDPLSVVYEYMLNDFRMIEGFRSWVYNANRRAVQWLKREVQPGDVVVTHHVPTMAVVPDKWRGSEMNRFFVCELGNLIAHVEPAVWVFGHTHDSCDEVLGGTRLVCNPFGYVRYEENPGFVWKKLVEI